MQTKTIILLFSLLLGSLQILAQESNSHGTDLGLSVQAYPAGIIPTINLEKFRGERTSWVFRLGANLVDRQDFSPVNDREEGAGFGASIGFRHRFPYKNGNFIVTLHNDFWNLWIDWRDDIEMDERNGRSYTLVVQPWLEGGYLFNLGSSSRLGLSLGFGREINAITVGDEVAQGWIGSLSLQYYFGL